MARLAAYGLSEQSVERCITTLRTLITLAEVIQQEHPQIHATTHAMLTAGLIHDTLAALPELLHDWKTLPSSPGGPN